MDDKTTTPEQPQQDCSLMKLPTKPRIRIYSFALQHIMDKVATEEDETRLLTWRPSNYKITPLERLTSEPQTARREP
jgi:isochorismate hydrolase